MKMRVNRSPDGYDVVISILPFTHGQVVMQEHDFHDVGALVAVKRNERYRLLSFCLLLQRFRFIQ